MLLQDIILLKRGDLQYSLMIILLVIAFARGAWPERASTCILIGMVIIDQLQHFFVPAGHIYDSVNYGHLIIDTGALVAFGYLAVRANRIYPLWLLAAQLIACLTHLNREISDAVHPAIYLILNRAPSYVQIIAITLGLWAHRRRFRLHGPYRSWSTSSVPFSAPAQADTRSS